MITGFNKKELRLFEKYRNKYNKFSNVYFDFGLFIHEVYQEPCYSIVNPNPDFLDKNWKLITRNVRKSKRKLK